MSGVRKAILTAAHAVVCLGLVSQSVPALAAGKNLNPPSGDSADLAELRSSLASLQTDDARLLSIAWRIATANAPFCAQPQMSVGLLPLDASSFAKPNDIRAALGITGEFAVQAVAAGSPAALAGLQPGEELISLDGVRFADLETVPAGSFSRLTAFQTRVESLLTEKGSIEVEVQRPGADVRKITLQGVPACRSRVELLTDGNEAAADGERIIISRRFLALARSDDEASFFVGHELAHNILRHRALLDKTGRHSRNIRATERAADRLAMWLLANAGYQTLPATQFMERWGKRQANLVFHNSTHDHWRSRLGLLQSELAAIETARAAQPGTPVDWRPLFPR